jgi:site-specific DNA-cytosine methylase
MRILELFSGTGSMGRAFTNQGWEVTSLDASPKAEATICIDIRLWDYTSYEVGYFDVIWASPVCTHYSIARTTAKTPRNLEWADSLVLKTLEIIDYFKPSCWYIENPQL